MPISYLGRRAAHLRSLTALALGLGLSGCTGMSLNGYNHDAANMIVHHTSVAGVARRCGKHLPAHRAQALGCALGDQRLCLVYLPHKASVGPVAYARLYRHERAHCNGWRH